MFLMISLFLFYVVNVFATAAVCVCRCLLIFATVVR